MDEEKKYLKNENFKKGSVKHKGVGRPKKDTRIYKRELIKEIANETNFLERNVILIISTFLYKILYLCQEKPIVLPGFGKFKIVEKRNKKGNRVKLISSIRFSYEENLKKLKKEMVFEKERDMKDICGIIIENILQNKGAKLKNFYGRNKTYIKEILNKVSEKVKEMKENKKEIDINSDGTIMNELNKKTCKANAIYTQNNVNEFNSPSDQKNISSKAEESATETNVPFVFLQEMIINGLKALDGVKDDEFKKIEEKIDIIENDLDKNDPLCINKKLDK